MVADILNHPTAMAAGKFFREALTQTIALAKTIAGAAAGLVKQGVGHLNAGIKPALTAPAVAVAPGQPRAGQGIRRI